MKKSVRIRKALPGETPGYYNKTAKFLKKAQMGMEVAAPSKDPQRINKIYDNAYISLKNDSPPDVVYNELVSDYALDQNTALTIIRAALSQLAQQGYIDPNNDPQKKEAQEEQPEDQQQQQSEEEDQAASEEAEQEEYDMAAQQSYDEEDESRITDRSHLRDFTEEEQQQSAFASGGETYEDYDYDMGANEYSNLQNQLMNQYSTAGENEAEGPFSMEELMAMTPGMQDTSKFPDLSYYLPNYSSVSDSYQAQDYLPTAAQGAISGGPWPPNTGLSKFLQKVGQLPTKYNLYQPMTNLSAVRNMVPIFSGLGKTVQSIPKIGSSARFQPKLETTFTQNRNALWEQLTSTDPRMSGIFSKTADGDLSPNRLLLYQDDVYNIINSIEGSGPELLTLADIQPQAAADGLVSGIYPMNAKVIGSVDDKGNKFFEIKHTFKPNEPLPFGSIPSKAKELTLKNRFYYNLNPDTGKYDIFDMFGNPLTTGAQTKYRITRPKGTTMFSNVKQGILKDALSSASTPFPSYTEGFTGLQGLNRVDLSATAPKTWEDLGPIGAGYRFAETLGTTGLNRFFRTQKSDIEKVTLPTFGYSLSGLGPQTIDPATESAEALAADIKNATNFRSRLGLKTALALGIPSFLGYQGYQAYQDYMYPCQCVDPTKPNYMAPDQYNNCPCEQEELQTTRLLDPDIIQEENPLVDPNSYVLPDTLEYLRSQGVENPSEENYYIENVNNPNIEQSIIDPNFKKGGSFKKKFIKRLTSMFEEGGAPEDPSLGKGERKDTLTKDVEKKKTIFTGKLKTNSNKAISEEIYKNAQHNPKIMNMLMQDGFKENLADENPMQPGQPQARYGGNFMNPFGGFVDMDSKSPLTKFIYGGDEPDYYEPNDVPEARNGGSMGGEYYTDWLSNQPNKIYNTGEDPYELTTTPLPEELITLDQTTDESGNSTDEVVEETAETKCGPGTVYNAQYGKCIPIAKINYIPHQVRRSPGLYGTLAPWNPFFGYAGSWNKKMGSPYMLGSKDPYSGELTSPPIARYVTKKGLLGRPKKWIDIYQTGDQTGVNLNNLEQLLGQGNSFGNRNIKDFAGDMRLTMAQNRGNRVQNRNERRSARAEEKEKFFPGGQVTCPPGYVKDPVSGLCKNFAGQIAPSNETTNAANTFQSNAQSLMNTNPFQSTGVNSFTGENYAYTKDGKLTVNDFGQTTSNATTPPDENLVGVEYKRKDMRNIDPEAGVNVFNAGARGVLGAFDRMQNKKKERNLIYDTVDPMNLYASANEQDRGDWQDFGSKSGMYRYNQQGQDRSSRATFGNYATSKYGGYMQAGGFYEVPSYEEDAEVYMTPEELEQFLAAGGQVEYL